MKFYFDTNFTQEDKKLFIEAQKNDLSKICTYLQTDENLVEKTTYRVFGTRETKQDADPNHSISRASARFEEMAIYRFWLGASEDSHFPHELTHLVAHKWANPYFPASTSSRLPVRTIETYAICPGAPALMKYALNPLSSSTSR